MTSKVLPVGGEVAGLRHPAATDVAGRKWLPSLPPRLPRHLSRLPGDANSFGPGGLKRRRIGGSRRLMRSTTFLWDSHSCGLQGRLGAAHRRPRLGRMSKGSSGGLYCPGRGGLNRRSGTGRGARTKLSGPEAHSRELAACVQNRINMRYHTLQYRPETIHRLVRRIPQPFPSLSPLFSDDPGVQRTQHHTRRRLRTDIVMLRSGSWDNLLRLQ